MSYHKRINNHIFRIVTYIISSSYHFSTYLYMYSSFRYPFIIISFHKHFVLYRSLTYHSLNVLIHMTIILLHERTLVISFQERILTLSFYQSIIILSLSTYNLTIFFYQLIGTISFSIHNLTVSLY